VGHEESLVARVADLTETELPAPPVLAVEVLSPDTRMIDLNLKVGRLARAGTPWYWTVGPHEPRLTVRQLVDGAYREVADVTGEEPYTSTLPYSLTVVPARLVG